MEGASSKAVPPPPIPTPGPVVTGQEQAWTEVTSWEEPGGDRDSPQCPLPEGLSTITPRRARGQENRDESVSEAEVDWMATQRPLVFDMAQLSRDYGEKEATQMQQAMGELGVPVAVAGVFAWPGVGSRWPRFLAWWKQLPLPERPDSARSALLGFARTVGRVRTFRALALDDAGLKRILSEDEIFPSGRLRDGVDAAHLRRVVDTHGVAKVTVVRLYISNMPKIGGVDPSISLHDDWQTTSVIASGYASNAKKVNLFELSVPAVESVGWTLNEVAQRSCDHLGSQYADHERWFKFPSPAVPQGTWFDSMLQRTERYGLYSVPHLHSRLMNIYVFDTLAQLKAAVNPFVKVMAERQSASATHSRKAQP